MGNTVIKRIYSIPDADMYMFGSNLVSSLRRDSVQFEEYGVSEAEIDAYIILLHEYSHFPDDLFLLGNVMVAAEDKEELQDELKVAMRSITVRAEMKWGENSPKYKKFGVIGMNKLNDRELFFTARRVHYVGSNCLAELADMGLTLQVLNDYAALCQRYEDALNAIRDAQAERDIKADERVELANRLYSFITKYCNLGKQIWGNVNEASYNDYLIYNEPSGTGLPVPPKWIKYKAKTYEVRWSKAGSATSYRFVYKLKDSSGDIQTFYEGRENHAIFHVPPGEYIVKVCGHNPKGYGEFGGEMEIILE